MCREKQPNKFQKSSERFMSLKKRTEMDEAVYATILSIDSQSIFKEDALDELYTMDYNTINNSIKSRFTKILNTKKMIEAFKYLSTERQLKIILSEKEFSKFQNKYEKVLEVLAIINEQDFWQACAKSDLAEQIYLLVRNDTSTLKILQRIVCVFKKFPQVKSCSVTRFCNKELEEQLHIVLSEKKFKEYKKRVLN